MRTEAIIYMFEDEDRITVKCSFRDITGAVQSENRWTFDIVDERLLLRIINQTICNHRELKKIYLVLPANEVDGEIISGDRFTLSRNFRSKIDRSSAEIIIKNDMNTAAGAYRDMTVTLYFPYKGSPVAGMVTDRYFGELKNLMPDVNLKQLYSMPYKKKRKMISKLLMEVNDIFFPDRIVIYSQYVDSKLLEGASFELKTPVSFKNMEEDIESGNYFKEALFMFNTNIPSSLVK